MAIKIGCISDLHGYVQGLSGKTYSEVSLLILAGDIANGENYRTQEDWYKHNFEIFKDRNIFPDLEEIIILPGNHYIWLERNYQNILKIHEFLGGNVYILVDSSRKFTSIEGDEVNIWGNPRTSLYTFAFPHLAGNLDLQMIPRDGSIDILVTHEAPRLYGIPCIKETQGEYHGEDEPGNLALANTVLEVKPKYHVFGHIHYPCQAEIKGIKFMNVSQQIRPGDIYKPELYIIDYKE